MHMHKIMLGLEDPDAVDDTSAGYRYIPSMHSVHHIKISLLIVGVGQD